MPQNNLRVLWKNNITSIAVNSNTVAAPSLLTDKKTDVWVSESHSSPNVKTNMVLTLNPNSLVGGVILPYTNLTQTATIRVRALTGNEPILGGTVDSPTINMNSATVVYDSGVVQACPYEVNSEYIQLLGLSKYSYGGYRAATVWFPTNINCTSVLVEILDTNTSNVVEIGKVLAGEFWSPIYNTSFGASVGYQDMTGFSRTESGDQEIVKGPRYKTLSFEVKWLSPADKTTLISILQRNGKSTPVYISVFPQITGASATEKQLEGEYSIYGRLTETQALVNSTFGFYSSSVQIDEI